MEVQKIVVVVEDVEAARTALEWALRNLLRCGDVLTLLHVFTAPTSSRKKMRLLRLRGYQLALSFKEICSTSFNTNIEIIVTEGDEEGRRIVAVVREIGADALVLGLHQNSFLYRVAMGMGENNNNSSLNLRCRIVAVKQPEAATAPEWGAVPKFQLHSSTNLDFSQIDLSALHQIPEHHIPPQKIPYRICPSPHAIIWRSRKSREKKTTTSPTN